MRSDIELALQVVHSDVGFTQGGMLAGLGLSPVRMVTRGVQLPQAGTGFWGASGYAGWIVPVRKIFWHLSLPRGHLPYQDRGFKLTASTALWR